MNTKEQKETKVRMTHIRLPESMHKKVRIGAAETDQTIQNWVFEAMKRELLRQEAEDHEKAL